MDIFANFLGLPEWNDQEIKKTLEYIASIEPDHSIPGAFSGWKIGEHTEEHRKNMSIAASKRIRTKEHIEKLHNGRRNSKNSEKHKAALIASRLGSKHTKESKEKMSISKKANPKNKEIASAGGKASAAARPSNYKEIQSARIKLWWAERKKKIGG